MATMSPVPALAIGVYTNEAHVGASFTALGASRATNLEESPLVSDANNDNEMILLCASDRISKICAACLECDG